MTRKDFELIAATLKAVRGTTANHGLMDDIAICLAERLKDTNQQFNRDKFLRACGVKP